MNEKYVNEFNVGDKICLYGYDGVVLEVVSKLCNEDECTYLKVKFDNCDIVNTAYDCGWYGGTNNVVSYGYIK